MKKLIFTLLACYALSAHAQTNHLVISQVYGAGGNTDAPYTHDFVELYNPTTSAVSLSGWSLQYAGATSSNWNSNNETLSGSIAPGKYYLIQFGNVSSTSNLPTPDRKSSVITLSATAGKVALVRATGNLSGNCPTGTTIIDFVGYGNANCFEGAAIATPTNYINSISRKNNGCTDTDNNGNDFALTVASPRNSTSAGHTCNAGSISISAVSPNLFCVDASTSESGTVTYSATGTFSNSTFKAVLSNASGSFGFPVTVGSTSVTGTNPSGTISITIPAGIASGTSYRIRIEATSPEIVSSESNGFEIINGAKNLLSGQFTSVANNTTITLNWTNPTGCFDEIMIVAKQGAFSNSVPSGDGSAYTADLNFTGNGTAFDGGKVVYKGTTSGQTVTNLTNGITYSFKAFTRRGTNWSSGIVISDNPRRVPLPGEIVINQLNPQYSSTASDEYIEIVNLTDKPFDLSDVAIRVSAANGNSGVAGGTLSGIIPPYGFWLLSPNATITTGQTTGLARDGAIDAGLAATNNQVGLVRITDNTVLDAVAYGSITTPTYMEGTAAPNPTTGSRDGLKRATSGADNNNNRDDFTAVANASIELRNRTSRLANLNAVIPAGNYNTLEVTGDATLSGNITLSNKIVLTNGIFSLNSHNLSAATTTGSTDIKYIKTAGTGAFTITNVTTGAFFPVGNSTYNPVTISNGSGLNWTAHVSDDISPDPTPFYEEAAVQRTWNITPSATPTAGATVVFEYDENDPAQIGDHFNTAKAVQVWNYHSNNWQAVTAKQMPATAASGRKTVTLSNYNQFSPFAIVNEESVLPIDFTGFTARVQAGGVQLQFTNVSEKDVDYYEVQRSANGHDFEKLTQLVPQKNNGGIATYRWLDATPPSGEVWYRVKGAEADGTVNFTPQLQVNIAGKPTEVTVYPNPVRGRSIVLKTALPQGTYTLRVSSASGQQVLLQTVTHNGGGVTKTINLPAGLQPGVYLLQISSGSFVRQQTFVVL